MRGGSPPPPATGFRVQASTSEPTRSAFGAKLAARGPFETRRRTETLENRCVEPRPNTLFTCTSLRSEKSHTFDPSPKRPGARFGTTSCAETYNRKDKTPLFFNSGPILAQNGQSRKKCILECQRAPPGGPKCSTLATHGSCLREASETPCF